MGQIKEIIASIRAYKRGQTMTEYALILSAVAVVVFVGYQTMGTDIGTLLTNIDGLL
jgi:Flp pilus assembly pilin Flp